MNDDWSLPPQQPTSDPFATIDASGNVNPMEQLGSHAADLFIGIDPIIDRFCEFINNTPPWVPGGLGAVTGFEFGMRLAVLRPDLAAKYVEHSNHAGNGLNPAGQMVLNLINGDEPDDDEPEIRWNT